MIVNCSQIWNRQVINGRLRKKQVAKRGMGVLGPLLRLTESW